MMNRAGVFKPSGTAGWVLDLSCLLARVSAEK